MGEDGQFLGQTEPYYAVVLDLGLPKARRRLIITACVGGQTMPILVLTNARDRCRDKVNAFDAGADYLFTSPSISRTLLARVRRFCAAPAGLATIELSCCPFRLDTARSACGRRHAVKLTSP